ncbi:MAG: GNAT family N-acetyltransferase [Halobacteria archaeon]|nr:GNAT family N-acetyltransferase [Halobacteria archaeon]
MKEEDQYPEKSVSRFESPPLRFEDRDGRDIRLREYGRSEVEDEFEALFEMYRGFDTQDRAQGIPPIDEDEIRDWLDSITDGVSVVAWSESTAVGHAILVPDGEGRHSLAIFVDQEYQRSGIGSRLIRALLGHAVKKDVDEIWLTVERWNEAAISLYRDVGFEKLSTEPFGMRMGMEIADS